jgi:small subunit ribosomal protein S21
MQVTVHNNQIERAVRDLKKKLSQEGFFAEMKERRFYDKPSVQRKKKRAKAEKRRRKAMKRY